MIRLTFLGEGEKRRDEKGERGLRVIDFTTLAGEPPLLCLQCVCVCVCVCAGIYTGSIARGERRWVGLSLLHILYSITNW